MKIAIHHTAGTFSDQWIAYCQEKNIPYKIVNCYDTNIVEQLKDFDALLWHHNHVDYRDKLFAKQLLYSLQLSGIKVFPDGYTTWHFDDKVGQKYLLESVGARMVPSFVFYTKKEALQWVQSTSFPKVFKLRGGASSDNVKMVRSKREAVRLVNRAFGRGFSPFNRWNNLKERIRKVKEGKESSLGILKGLGRLIIPIEFAKMSGREKGYVYFQDFIENEGYDIRVVVVNNKAATIKRLVREKDFRASGSGKLIFENEKVDKRVIEEAFNLSRKLKIQSAAMDFIVSKEDGQIYVVELSYAFPMRNIVKVNGYWDENIKWMGGSFNPGFCIIEDLLSSIKH